MPGSQLINWPLATARPHTNSNTAQIFDIVVTTEERQTMSQPSEVKESVITSVFIAKKLTNRLSDNKE
jgi:hypothetical protein